MARRNTSRRVGNPGITKRFLGGVLGKGHWVLPEDEFVERVRQAMVARGLHQAGEPLEPHIVTALQALHEEAVEVYRRGGPDAVDEWVETVTGSRRKNPRVKNIAQVDEYLWAIVPESEDTKDPTHGRLYFYPVDQFRSEYTCHEEWLGPAWAYDSGYDLCRGRIKAYSYNRALSFTRYIGTKGIRVPCPVEKIKKEFVRLRPRYKSWTWEKGRYNNPVDLVTLVGLGIIAGAVQGIVEPYVTRHVYRMDRSLARAGGMHAA